MLWQVIPSMQMRSESRVDLWNACELLKLKWHHRYGVPVIFLRTAVRGTLHFSYRAAKIPGGLMFPRVAIHEIDPSVDGQLTDSTLLS